MTGGSVDAEALLRSLVPWAALPDDAPLPAVVRELNEELWRGMAAQWVLAGRPGDERELEPYIGVRALFNADLATHSPWYAPRQAWLVVRRPAGDGGWNEDHLEATERAAAQLVREAEERAQAAEDEVAALRARIADLEADLTARNEGNDAVTHPQILVTLTDTSNPHLQPRLPLVGLLELFEVGTDGRVISAVFREQLPPAELEARAAAGGFPPGPVVVDEPVFTYGLQPELGARGWAVPCGCDCHGDHLACTKQCMDWGCAHPVGVQVLAMTEAEAVARSGEPLADTDPIVTVPMSKVVAATKARMGTAASTFDDVVALLADLQIGVHPSAPRP